MQLDEMRACRANRAKREIMKERNVNVEKVIEIKNLKKNFGKTEVLRNIDFDIHRSEVICVKIGRAHV